MRTVAPRMNHAFGNTLMVEVKDLFPKMEILNQRRTSIADLERIEVIRYRPLGRSSWFAFSRRRVDEGLRLGLRQASDHEA